MKCPPMDIVERLRAARPCTQFDSAGRLISFGGEPTESELLAADEIARLRAALEAVRDASPDDTAYSWGLAKLRECNRIAVQALSPSAISD